MLIRRLFFILLLLSPVAALATDLAPWYRVDRFPYFHPWAMCQWYPSVDTGAGTYHHHGFNQFYGLSAAVSKDKWALEAEATFSRTTQHSITVENGRLTLRRRWSNDVVGDPVSFVTGLTLTGPTGRAIRDFNTIYHGKVEVELHAAIGQETVCREYWNSRWWGAFVVGKADRGAPWLRAKGVWESNACDQHQWKFFVEGAVGTGHHELFLTPFFDGYGRIRYRLVDIGAGYTFLVDPCGRMLTAEYIQRLYSRNTLNNTHSLVIRLLWPFSL